MYMDYFSNLIHLIIIFPVARSLPADVPWGLFLLVTHSFLPTDLQPSFWASVNNRQAKTSRNKPHGTSAGRLCRPPFREKIEKIACVAGIERWRGLGAREIERGLGLSPCISLSPPPLPLPSHSSSPSPPLPFLRLPRRLRKEHRKKLYNNPRNYATAKQFLWRKLYVQ